MLSKRRHSSENPVMTSQRPLQVTDEEHQKKRYSGKDFITPTR